MSEQLFGRPRPERPLVEHAYFEAALEDFRRTTHSLPHASGPEDIQCWCNPSIMAPCTYCEFGVDVVSDDEMLDAIIDADEVVVLDGDEDVDNIIEPWQTPCEYCGNSGLMDLEFSEIAGHTRLILVHRDT